MTRTSDTETGPDNSRDDQMAAAFDGLGRDAASVDTMAALRRIESRRQRAWGRPVGLLAMAAAALVVIVGVVALRPDADDQVRIGDLTETDSFEDRDAAGPSGVAILEGTSWTLVSGHGPGGDIPIVDGWPVTLAFENGMIGGTAACNGYGGTYQLDGSALIVDQVGLTEMGCVPDVSASESAYIAAFLGVETVSISGGELALAGPSVGLVFQRNQPVPTAQLIDQVWLLETLLQGESAATVAGRPATLVLRADATLDGATGCRGLTGRYVVSGNQIVFTDFAADGECSADLRAQDNIVVAVLEGGFVAEVDGDRLTLTSSGNEGLVYRAIDPDDAADVSLETITVTELLDSRPTEVVLVEGELLDTGGGWIVCDQTDRRDGSSCNGRWVVLTNPEPATDATPFRGRLVDDDRFAIDGRPDMLARSPRDEQLFDVLASIDSAAGSVEVGTFGFAATVRLGLTDQLLVTASSADLADPATWELDLEAFRGWVGPFSAIDLLARGGELQRVVGPHDHCASPPAPINDALRDARHLSVQPTGIDSCLQWWTVDLYLDDEGAVIAVTLDLWEP